jgi:hypothetical protein
MQDQDSRNSLNTSSLDEINASLCVLLIHAKANDVHVGCFQLSEGDILVGYTELQRVNEVDATNNALRTRRSTYQYKTKKSAENYERATLLLYEQKFLPKYLAAPALRNMA